MRYETLTTQRGTCLLFSSDIYYDVNLSKMQIRDFGWNLKKGSKKTNGGVEYAKMATSGAYV